MTQLDDHGARILTFVERYYQVCGRAPSFEEIGMAVGLRSKDHVSRDLRRLKAQGYLTYRPRVARSIILLKDRLGQPFGTPNDVKLPRMSALEPQGPLPAPNPELPPLDWVTIGRTLVNNDRDVYVLRVRGEAMVDALVTDGDLVLLKRQNSARNGELVALVDKASEKLSLRYYHRENGHVRLQPVNPTMAPSYKAPDEVEIQGHVLAIVRKAS